MAAAHVLIAAALGLPPPGAGLGVLVGVDVAVGVAVSVGVSVGVGVPVVGGVPVAVGVSALVAGGAAVRARLVGAGVPAGCECWAAGMTGIVGTPAVDPSTGAQARCSASRALWDARSARCTALVLSGGAVGPPEACPPTEEPVAADPAALPAVVPPVDEVAPLVDAGALLVGAAVAFAVALVVDAGAVTDGAVVAAWSAASDASSWARVAWAARRSACSAVGSIVARVWPADTWSPTATWRPETTPFAGKEAVTWSTRWAVPVRVSTSATSPRETVASR
jgi:hypothetical protein